MRCLRAMASMAARRCSTHSCRCGSASRSASNARRTRCLRAARSGFRRSPWRSSTKRVSSSDNERDTRQSARHGVLRILILLLRAAAAGSRACRTPVGRAATERCPGGEIFELAGLEIECLELSEVITQQFQPRFAILRRRGSAVALFARLDHSAARRPSRAARDSHRSDRAARVAPRFMATGIPSRPWISDKRLAELTPALASLDCSRTRATCVRADDAPQDADSIDCSASHGLRGGIVKR